MSLNTSNKTRVLDNLEIDTADDVLLPLLNETPQNNVVVLFKELELSNEKILQLLKKISSYQKMAKFSFVVVNSNIDIDELDSDIVIVPTLQEAHDIIEMEEIERDLGF